MNHVSEIQLRPVIFTLDAIGKSSALQSVRCMAGGTESAREVAIRVKATISDIPVPQGDWKEDYKKKNSKWNALLAASTAFFGITVFLVSNKGMMHQ